MLAGKPIERASLNTLRLATTTPRVIQGTYAQGIHNDADLGWTVLKNSRWLPEAAENGLRTENTYDPGATRMTIKKL